MNHTCHALGCKSPCPPRNLVCSACWSLVPHDIAQEVYRTVKLRGGYVDASWAPWWRAQARAIAHIARMNPSSLPHVAKWLDRELAFADRLERRPA